MWWFVIDYETRLVLKLWLLISMVDNGEKKEEE